MHATPSRRLVLAVLAAALASASGCSGSSVGPTPPPPSACLGFDQACGTGSECCSGDCALGACGCSAVGERCGTSNDCCTSVGPARCDAGVCASGQRVIGDVCTAAGQCASLNCDISGHCAAACSYALFSSCTARAQCCAPMGCIAGQCSLACGGDFDTCTSDLDCCSDHLCRAGWCQTGLCGTAGQRCASNADCCTAAQGGKSYFCGGSGTCTIGQPYDMPGHPPDACATDADCSGNNPCRGGYCHWPDGHQLDGHWCLDGQECGGGFCTSTAAGVPGTCCSGAGASCTVGGYATACCSGQGLACTGIAGAQSCNSCLDFDNSGPQGTPETQCTSDSQCCAGRGLYCVAGECCRHRGNPCTAGTGAKECCLGDTCGTVTDYSGTTTECCGAYGATSCGLYSACCDGLLCTSGTCLKGPGQACSGSGQCAESNGVACNLSTGTCCSHANGPCKADGDCCTNSCNTATGRCNAVPEYGSCLSEADCYGPDYNQAWNGQVCGGNAALGAQICCPVPGQTCLKAADCCETDQCQVPLYGSTSALCCRDKQASCSLDKECCTGTCWIHYVGPGPAVGTCCGYPWTPGFACATNADCCSTSSTGYIGSRCDTGRCCWEAGFQAGATNAALCCSGRVDQMGSCR